MRTRTTARRLPLVIALATALASCASPDNGGPTPQTGESATEETTQRVAVAELQPTSGHDARGKVVFREVDDGVEVHAELESLAEGAHGFHVHEKGDCSAEDASSAGGHFAPHGSPHGAPDDPADQRHAGDLGNVMADAEGNAVYDRVDPLLSLSGEHSIVGRAVIVHAERDDLETQPTGAAGARVACGVIELQ
jgi:Cu-Zn family superoxide dismutase